MDVYEHYRRRLAELIQHVSAGKHAHFAALIEKEGSYVSRLLYPPDKKGGKRLGVETMATIREKLNLEPGWFDLPVNSAMPKIGGHLTQIPAPTQKDKLTRPWPFDRVTPADWEQITPAQRRHIEDGIFLLLSPTLETTEARAKVLR